MINMYRTYCTCADSSYNFLFLERKNQIESFRLLLLKGLSHEIDFKNFDKFTELGLTKGRGWFFNLLGAPIIL